MKKDKFNTMVIHRKNKTPNKKEKKVFITIVLTMAIAVVMSIFIVASSLLFFYDKRLADILFEHEKESLSQTSYSANFMTEAASNLTMQLYFNKEIINLLYSKHDLDQQKIKEGIDQLTAFANTTPFVHSIYIYNTYLDNFFTSISTGGCMKSDQFFDKSILEIMSNPKDYQKLFPIPRKIKEVIVPIGQEQYSNAFTYLFYENLKKDTLNSAVVINISEEWMREMIASLNTSTISNNMIVNSNGIAIISSRNNNILEDLSNKPYIAKIIKDDLGSGYFLMDIGNKKHLVSYLKNEILDWIFIKTIPYTFYQQQMREVLKIPLIISLVILLIGIILSYYLSKRIYQPYAKILTRLGKMEEDKKDNATTIRKDWIGNLLRIRTQKEMLSFQKDMKIFDCKLKLTKPFYLVLLEVDHWKDYCNSFSLSDRKLMQFGMMNIASEVFSKNWICECIPYSEKHFFVFVNILQKSTTKELIESSKSLQKLIEKNLMISTSVSVSEMGYDYRDITILVNQSLELAKNKLGFGYHSCLTRSIVKKTKNQDINILRDKADKIYEKLRLGKKTEMIDSLNAFFDGFTNLEYQPIHSLMLYLILHINICIESPIFENENDLKNEISSTVSALSSFEVKEDMKIQFVNIFKKMIQIYIDSTNPKHQELVGSVKRVIENEYENKQLSLYFVADKYDISAYYLGRLFKKQEQQSFNDYLNHVRLEKAKSYLKTTNNNISEIAKQVGYDNVNYFYTLFKKIEGLTATQYRKRQNKK